VPPPEPVTYEVADHKSLTYTCNVCGSLVTGEEQETHTEFHVAHGEAIYTEDDPKFL